MHLAPGQRLLHLVLVERAGAGGMGEVWRARDEALGRDVAIKFLPEAVSADPERRTRFEREARLLAMLDHPSVARVFGFHEADGTPFLVLEFVEGEDLAERIARGPLPLDEALETAIAVARALEAAHVLGIVHRDLKPANIRRTPTGVVKVLDFGLAKAFAPTEGSPADSSRSPTITFSQTAAGVLLGTAAYMSPEQARGRAVDQRSDLWAFGCVLFEFLTGTRAFAGETLSDTLASVIRGEPDWSRLPPGLPGRVENLLRFCLAKDPDERWRDAGDARLELRRALGEVGAGGPEWPGEDRRALVAGRRRRGWAFGAAALLGLAGGAALFAAFVPRREPIPRLVEATIPMPPGWSPRGVAISPDGSTLGIHAEADMPPAGGAGFRLLLRRLSDSAPVLLEGSAWSIPSFSPDSTQLAFIGPDPSGRGVALFRAPIGGTKPPLLVARLEERSRSIVWCDGATLCVCEGTPPRLRRIPIDGRPEPAAVELKTLAAGAEILLHGALPDGTRLATIESWRGGYHQDAVRIDPADGSLTELVRNAYYPTLVGDVLVFSRRDRLVIVPFDRRRGAVAGAEEVVATGLGFPLAWGGAPFWVSSGGDLVHLGGGTLGENRPLVWVGADGKRTPWEGATGAFAEELGVSRDGRIVAATRIGRDFLYEIWASGTDRAAFRRVIALEGMDCGTPAVSPTGDRIAASCGGDPEREGIYVVRLSGGEGNPKRVAAVSSEQVVLRVDWSPDGETLSASVRGSDRVRIVAADPDATEPATIDSLLTIERDASGLTVSDDHSLAAIVLHNAAEPEVAIAPWVGGRLGTAIPIAAGGNVNWTGVRGPGGRELIFRGLDGRLRRTFVDAQGRPGPLEFHPFLTEPAPDLLALALLADGRMLAVQKEPAEREGGTIVLHLGWGSTLVR